MDSRLVRRPVLDLLSGRSQCLLSLNASSRRQQSSYRRSKQRLNVKPDSSFLSHDGTNQDHIIFNPPSSAPSVLHTPLKFLPKEDKRRQLLASRFQSSATSTLPPPVYKTQRFPHHHLTDKDIAEIIRLKRQDPEEWTNTKLSRKFNCSNHFISICLDGCGAEGNAERKKAMAEELEAVKSQWGPRRRKAREDRAKRFELALKGE
ncbi:mitochondrial ribosomal protein subunit L20-domain-containing protein [Leptodontidium sp. 2 PMI_412]|nr:mitochondrial ribosomal protein subunit L20-domain-containing protein [Leptodontidium sp. 2 PMI_412]